MYLIQGWRNVGEKSSGVEETYVSSVLQGLGGSRLQGGSVSLKSLLVSGQLLSTGLLLLSVDLS